MGTDLETPVSAETAGTDASDRAHEATRAMRAKQLPGRVYASARVPLGEVATLTVVVPFVSVPLLLATMAPLWAYGISVLLTFTVAWLALARRIVVGRSWIADRRLFAYRITHVADISRVDVVETAHGGAIKLYPAHGRAHRLGRVEIDSERVRVTLAAMLLDGPHTVAPQVVNALRMPAPR